MFFRHLLHLFRSYRVNFLHVGFKIIIAKVVQIREGKLADDALPGRILQNEQAGDVVLDSFQFCLGWRFFLQAIDL